MVTKAKITFFCSQMNWVCPSEAQRFRKMTLTRV